jgi:hypothetical protein
MNAGEESQSHKHKHKHPKPVNNTKPPLLGVLYSGLLIDFLMSTDVYRQTDRQTDRQTESFITDTTRYTQDGIAGTAPRGLEW